ncbi:hypothetical protein [Flectobacillus longus]|uniref:hypothetical protein n=1 Tax=Flectobacillus longus TaxID=2984207 RepID=UPI0024B663A9|nr:hypothetical protein [Flectobacillus longus]MDI9880783.1 hypothetical protein [Flectobacillus longus]
MANPKKNKKKQKRANSQIGRLGTIPSEASNLDSDSILNSIGSEIEDNGVTSDPTIDIDNENLSVQKKLKEAEELKLTLKKLKYKIERYYSNSKVRILLVVWTVAIVSVWLLIVALLLALNNNTINLDKHYFPKSIIIRISDNVLMTLISTTTVNILGLTYIVLRGHFKNLFENEKTKKKSSIKSEDPQQKSNNEGEE